MRTKAKAIEECATLFEIAIPKETIAKALEEVYEEISKVADIPGFRTGKAPRDLVRKRYFSNAKEEVLKRMIPRAYKYALEEHKIAPIGLPEINDVIFAEDESLSFKAKVDTRPKFKLKDYKGVKIKKVKALVKDEDVEKTLESLRELNAKYTSEESRPVQIGDYVICDMECFVDAKPIHKKRENIWLSIEKESFMPGLNERMVGMGKGEERDIELILPEKYPDVNAAGKNARYHIKVKEIKIKQLPNLDDEFAKDLGKTNLEGLRKEVSAELVRRTNLSVEIDMENQLLKRLTDDNVFPVPSNLVAKQTDYLIEDAKRRLEEKGFKRGALDAKNKEFVEKFRDDAVRQTRLMFILEEIAKDENIKIGESDIEEAYKDISAETGQSLDKVKGYYEKEDLADSLKEKIREEKTIKFLLDNAEIIEMK